MSVIPISVNQNTRIVPSYVTAPQKAVIPDASQRRMQASFGATSNVSYSNIRTQMTQEEVVKYSELVKNLDAKERTKLNTLLKTGVLLNNNSNDKSTTLDNLYKIISEERADGLTSKVVLRDTVNILENPSVITQTFGDIPKMFVEQILQNAKPNEKAKTDKITKDTINVNGSSACVSASIEYNLAKQTPAEFARFTAGLTSPKLAVEKVIDLSCLTDNKLDSLSLLDTFKVPYELIGQDKAKLTLAPDKNAYIRAQIQDKFKDSWERSSVDALMQSTFMNVGSQQTYDALTDTRGGDMSPSDKGLIEYEKTFTESIVQNKNKTSLTFQNLDENAKLVNYTQSFDKTMKNITDALAIGENVIVGYVFMDKDKKVVGGHEITIVGIKTNNKGEKVFICNDTDDNYSGLIEIKAKTLLPCIHHAGLPQEVVSDDALAQG